MDDFAPLGATFYYRQVNIPISPPSPLLEMQVIGDTIIDDKPCRIFGLFNDIGNCILKPEESDTFFIHESDNQVYFYEQQQFRLLYDFNKGIGESYYMQIPYSSGVEPDSILVEIIDVDEIEIDGNPYARQIVPDLISDFVGKEIILGIGGSKFFLPHIGVCDPHVQYLICYETEDLQLSIHENETCDVINPVSDVFSGISIKSYPNPVDNAYHIESSVPLDNYHMQLISVTGEMIIKIQILHSSQVIRMDHLESGIYFIHIEDEQGHLVFMERIVRY